MCRHRVFPFLLCLSLILFSGCKKDDVPEVEAPLLRGSLLIQASSLYTLANGISKVEISVFEIVEGEGRSEIAANLYIGDSLVANASRYTYLTNEPGFVRFKAELGGQTSDIGITARAPLSLDTLEIPIVFHLIKDHRGPINRQSLEEPGQLEALLKEANAMMNPGPATLNSIQDNTNWHTANVKLVAATHDPEGNLLPIPGLHIYDAPTDTLHLSFQADWLWDTYWHPDYYMNAWVGYHENPRYGGQGTYPFFEPGSPLYQGASVRAKPDSPDFLTGILLARVDKEILLHELGHYIGLPHVFSEICEGDSDFCPDTHHYVRVGFGDLSGTERQGCNGIRFLNNNHMDYGPRSHMFTYDQVNRMRHGLQFGMYRPYERIRQGGGVANLEPNNRAPRVHKPDQVVLAPSDY